MSNDAKRSFPAEQNGYVEIDGVRLKMSHPNESKGQWIGQQEILNQLLACWLVVDEQDMPLAELAGKLRSLASPG